MRSLEEIQKENGDQPKEENKPMDYLSEAKDNYRVMNFNNSSYSQEAQTAALIFIGEQLERIANALEYRL
jgi:uncharacterized protein with HEPN domain